MDATARHGLKQLRVPRSVFRPSVLVCSVLLVVALVPHAGAQWPCHDAGCKPDCASITDATCLCPNNGCQECPYASCVSDANCGPLGTCWAGLCVSKACTSDSDCGSTGVCRIEDGTNGLCFKKCTTDAACGDTNLTCKDGAWCAAKQCASDSDCSNGRTCQSGKCRHPSTCLAPASASALSCFPDGGSFCPGAQWFSLALLPDTQSYVKKIDKTTIFDCQTEWLRANTGLQKDARHEGIKFVLHEGDIVYSSNRDDHWARGKRALCVLKDVPNSTVVLGNMDDPGSANNRCYQYIPLSMVAPQCQTFPCDLPGDGQGSFNQRNEATYRMFSAAGLNWIIIGLRWGATTTERNWAKSIAAEYPDRRVIIVTHDFYNPTTDPPSFDRPQSRDGSNIWASIVKDSPNVFLTFNAHNYPERGRHRSFNGGRQNANGESFEGVWSMFSNFQEAPSDPLYAGMMEMVSICPKLGKIAVRHYSPWTNECRDDIAPDEFNYDIPKPNSGERAGFSLRCGDGMLGLNEHGVQEVCDDGNTNNGDCCSADCMTAAPANTSCEYDQNVCTHGTCDGSGNCDESGSAHCYGTCTGGSSCVWDTQSNSCSCP